jgi:tight adherence protein B
LEALFGVKGLLGFKGIMFFTFMMTFVYCYKNSVGIFDWVEKQTLGTRTYIQEKLELLFIEIDPNKITYTLLFLSIGLSSISLIVVGYFVNWIFGFIVATVMVFVGFKIPKPIIDFMVERRIKQYAGQMVDGLTLLSNGIRAGLSVPQALGMVVDEMPIPISQEFNLILQQNRIGVPLEECFENLAKRVPTEDNDMFVSAINILRETGGNLAEVFDTIVIVIRERIRLQQKVDTFTAQGMFQGVTIFMMPFGIGAIYAVSDPDSMVPLFTTPIGLLLLFVALLFDIVGGIVILKIVKIKI